MVKKTSIILVIIILSFAFYSAIKLSNHNGVKYFYCLSNDRCITVWKKTNGEVYLIFGKYKNDYEANTSYIKTTNKQFLTLYFSPVLSHKIIVRDEGNLENSQKTYKIKNNIKSKWKFDEYSVYYKSILYEPNVTKFNNVRSNIDYLTINIEENYATDKTGQKILSQ